ncbi:MAG: CotH kinase family protein [Sphingobacteriales bacterium]|jgi:subtilisin-like proprotein convertase family protein|nr:CotH kinase family protein [Sphingobacteriales bacterium]
MYRILALLILCSTHIAQSQSFSCSNGSIPDNGVLTAFPVAVSGLPVQADSTFGLKSVCINVTHPYVSDLEIYLECPDGTKIELSTRNGGSGDNYWSTCFYDTVAGRINNGNAPFTGSYRPEGWLFTANNRQNSNGTWNLLVRDAKPGVDAGFMNGAYLTFAPMPFSGLALQSSNLPIVRINTYGAGIPDDPKIPAYIDLIDNGPGQRNYIGDKGNIFAGPIGIETRGSFSQTLPKKSYGFDIRDSLGNETDTPLVGMPSESDWIFNASYSDKTFLRNCLSYHIAQQLGNYASRFRHCEIVINGQYQGIFILLEKIKRGPGRVDIANLTPADISGDSLTGGYILKVDKQTGSVTGGFPSQYPPYNGGPTPDILYEYPDGNTLVPQQIQYIQQYCDSFENALRGIQFTDQFLGYRPFIEVDSWIDYLIINEFAKNIDGFRISSYFHKRKVNDGGQLVMGPVWDFDIAWGNANYDGGDVISGYSHLYSNTSAPNQVPFWWVRLQQDPYFSNRARCRWESLRAGVLSNTALFAWIDSMALVLDEAQARNFVRWPILGVYVWPNPAPYPSTYGGVIQELKNWVTNRSTWLDANLPGVCIPQSLDEGRSVELRVLAYPNPAREHIWLVGTFGEGSQVHIRIRNSLGQVLFSETQPASEGRILIQPGKYASGMLLIEVENGDQRATARVFRN